jgi:hypothetical protein
MKAITVPKARLVAALADHLSEGGPSWSRGYAVWVGDDGQAIVARRGRPGQARIALAKFLAVPGGLTIGLWKDDAERAQAYAWVEANLAEQVGEVAVRYR